MPPYCTQLSKIIKKRLLVDVQIPEDLPPEEGVKDVRVGDDQEDDDEDDNNGKGSAAADNQNLDPHLASMTLLADCQPGRFFMPEDRRCCHVVSGSTPGCI